MSKLRIVRAAVTGILALAVAGAAQAADHPSATAGTSRNADQAHQEPAAQAGAGPHERRALKPMRSQQDWAEGYAREHNGRVTREAYMNEVGRRWASVDRNGQGLTPEELRALYGGSAGAAPATSTVRGADTRGGTAPR